MSEIDLTEAIAAAHAVTCRVPGCTASYDATVMVRAALPHIERQIREQVAREIEGYRGPSPWGLGIRPRHPSTNHWVSSEDAVLAARIARGEA